MCSDVTWGGRHEPSCCWMDCKTTLPSVLLIITGVAILIIAVLIVSKVIPMPNPAESPWPTAGIIGGAGAVLFLFPGILFAKEPNCCR